MTFPTHEQYDENEYFIKFLRIHPYLSYANNTYDKKKLELQLNLLNKLNDKIISIEELKTTYNKIIEKERNKNIKIEDLKMEHKNIINNLQYEIENEIIDFMNIYI
jgi:hypothetical protein